MKNKLNAIVVGAALGFAACGVSYGMSEMVRLDLQPEWPTTPAPGNVVLYKVTATREGQGLLEVSLRVSGLPEGATASFSPNPLRFTGRVPEVLTATLTITTPDPLGIDNVPFVVTGWSRRQVASVTNKPSSRLRTMPPDAPVLAIDALPGGGIRIRGQGTGGVTYGIEAASSPDSTAWNRLENATADGNGNFTYIVSDTQGNQVQFYRAVAPAN